MTKLELLNVFLNDRLTAAAEEIFRAVKDTVAEYQSEILRSKEENERLRRLLNGAVQRLLLQPGEEPTWSRAAGRVVTVAPYQPEVNQGSTSSLSKHSLWPSLVFLWNSKLNL